MIMVQEDFEDEGVQESHYLISVRADDPRASEIFRATGRRGYMISIDEGSDTHSTIRIRWTLVHLSH